MRTIKILLAAVLITGAGLESCTKEKQTEIATNIVTSYFNKGKWKVTKLEEDGKNETDHYDGYVFQFNADGNVTATKGNDVMKGTWSTYADGSKTRMKLNFTGVPFSELNEDWLIKSGGATAIQLEHTSGGNGGTDYLNFEKI